MSCKNITKKFLFVTILSLFCSYVAGCDLVPAGGYNTSNRNAGGGAEIEFSKEYQKPRVAGTITSAEITESSGLVASRCSENVLWTHNDSGDAALIFALDAGSAKRLGTWKVTGAKHYDWEDMGTFQTPGGECFLYIGDIGNNTRERGEFIIYRVKEPSVTGASAADSSRKNPLPTEPAEAIKVAYPDVRHDAETLMVHPQTGDVYILSKRISGASGVYKLPATGYSPGKINALEKVADLAVPALPNGFLTGGDISPDGKRVVVCDYFGGYELVLPAAGGGGAQPKNFDEIWKEKPLVVELGERRQGEAICYTADGRAILATSEKKNSPLIRADRK